MDYKKYLLLKRTSKAVWIFLLVVAFVALLLGFWLVNKMWPIFFWVVVAVLVSVVIIDFVVFRQEQKQ